MRKPEGIALSRGDRRTRQELTIQVPVTRLRLVSVDDAVMARLKLEPRFELIGALTK